jgi:hypothetical protein
MEAQTIIAKRIAQELRSGMLINLGIGIPTLVANHVPQGLSVYFQSENGLIGTGPIPEEGMAHPTLTDAAGHPVSALPGASTFDSAMSFGLIRGGHLDMTVLGGLQVDSQGHLANWMIPGKMVPGIFDQTAADVERTVREEAPFSIDGREMVARHLENAIGQAVHLVYLLNTENVTLGDGDVDRLCDLIGRNFPSATVQPAEALYEGKKRSILMARIRTDSTDAVIELAQRLCIAFDQQFVGIEVGGRYIRIYGDDTD